MNITTIVCISKGKTSSGTQDAVAEAWSANVVAAKDEGPGKRADGGVSTSLWN